MAHECFVSSFFISENKGLKGSIEHLRAFRDDHNEAIMTCSVYTTTYISLFPTHRDASVLLITYLGIVLYIVSCNFYKYTMYFSMCQLKYMSHLYILKL